MTRNFHKLELGGVSLEDRRGQMALALGAVFQVQSRELHLFKPTDHSLYHRAGQIQFQRRRGGHEGGVDRLHFRPKDVNAASHVVLDPFGTRVGMNSQHDRFMRLEGEAQGAELLHDLPEVQVLRGVFTFTELHQLVAVLVDTIQRLGDFG